MAPDASVARGLSRDLFQAEWLLGDLLATPDEAERRRIRSELADLARRLRAGAPALRDARATARMREQRGKAARDVEAVAGEIDAVSADADAVSGREKAERLLDSLRARSARRLEPRRQGPVHTLRIRGPGRLERVSQAGSPLPPVPVVVSPSPEGALEPEGR
jgi:hypothetical protein